MTLAATSLALSVMFAVSGCSGGDPTPGQAATSPGADAPQSALPTSTETSPTAEPTPADTGPVRLSAAEFTQLATGALDDTSGAQLSVENGLGLLSGEGQVDFRDSPASLAMTVASTETGDAQPVQVRVIDTTLYIEDEQGFLRVDIDSDSNPFGSSFSEQLDPRMVLDAFVGDLVSASSRGTVERDGETLDVYRAMADGPAVVATLAPELADQDDVVVPELVRCDLTLDEDGRARTLVVGLGEENGELSYTLDDWSTDVTVEQPPAGQVSDLPDLGG